MSVYFVLSTILVACVLTCFASHINKKQNELSEMLLGNTYHLQRFYWKISETVQQECRRYLYSELNNHDYQTERQRSLRDKMAIDIGKIDRLSLSFSYQEGYLCFWYEAFKLAKEILISYVEIKEAFNDQESPILNGYYQTVGIQCPLLTFDTATASHTSAISLLLTNETTGFGQFMGRSRSPYYRCCEFLDSASGEAYRLELAYKSTPVCKKVKYDDVVAIGTQGKYLKNEYPPMRWDEYQWQEKTTWKIEPFCNDPTNDRHISQCDLVTFRTLNAYEDGYYLVNGTTSQTKRNGVFAAWSPSGDIPYYARLDDSWG